MNNEIKSQDDLNRQGRESDVLIATIMKCQELVRKNVELENDVKELKQKIHILTESQMKLENIIGELGQENARLKDLLKECVVIIGYADTISNNEENKKTIHELLTKIEEALK